MRWIAILYGRLGLSLAATSGVHTATDVLKLVMAGADITQMCSALLKGGCRVVHDVLTDLRQWMEENEYESIEQMKGSLSQRACPDPAAFERANYMDQHSQDWGVHDIHYAIFGHQGDWRAANSEWRGRRFNQPLRGFWCDKHDGSLGRSFAFAHSSTPQVDIRAIKRAEESDRIIVRVQELTGKPAKNVRITFPTAIAAVDEVDGQERKLESLSGDGKTFQFDVGAYGMIATLFFGDILGL